MKRDMTWWGLSQKGVIRINVFFPSTLQTNHEYIDNPVVF